jgi:hypothetical protein
MDQPMTSPSASRPIAQQSALFAVRGRLVVDGKLLPGAVVVRDGSIAAVLRDPAPSDLPTMVLDAPVISPDS